MDQPSDHDYEWLMGHLKSGDLLKPRRKLAEDVGKFLENRIESGSLPYTLGVFGGWGSGKTTFLALLAKYLEKNAKCRVIYFNAWKYAGFMEIVPSLIYKILHYGVDTDSPGQAAMGVLLSLGKEHADTFGEWAKGRIGVDPVRLFKEVYGVAQSDDSAKFVNPKILDAYYTQVDRAQDTLSKVLGTTREGEAPQNALVVLVDELDRCDPDEAFDVIKQTRVLFAMRNLPLAFVICANPDSIGLAIKHRYGLQSDESDYEARKILEKFVDSSEDLRAPVALAPLLRALWTEEFRKSKPWVLAMDETYPGPKHGLDVVKNASGFDEMTTAVPLYANLRVLLKSFRYVCDRASTNRHLLWTIWHLEIVSQIHPHFRSELRVLAGPLEELTVASYTSLSESLKRAALEDGRINYQEDIGRTSFAVFRSHFWEHARGQLAELDRAMDPETKRQADALRKLLAEPLRVNFVILLCMLPFRSPASFADARGANPFEPDFRQGLQHEFAWLLANY